MSKIFNNDNGERIKSILKDAEEKDMLIMVSGGKCLTCGSIDELLSMLSVLISCFKESEIPEDLIRKAVDLGFKDTNELKEMATKKIDELLKTLMND